MSDTSVALVALKEARDTLIAAHSNLTPGTRTAATVLVAYGAVTSAIGEVSLPQLPDVHQPTIPFPEP